MTTNTKIALSLFSMAVCGLIGHLEMVRMDMAVGRYNDMQSNIYGLSMSAIWFGLCLWIIWGFLPAKNDA